MTAKKACSLLRIAGVLSVLIVPALQVGATTFKARPTPTPTHHVTVISALTASSITVEMQIVADKSGKVLDKTSRTYGVSNFTEITLNGQRATLANLKPGMKVSVTIGTDPSKAARIVANG